MDAYWQTYANYAATNIVSKLEQKEISSLNDFLKKMYEYSPKTYILIPAVFPLIEVAVRTGRNNFLECITRLASFMDYCSTQGASLENNAARLNSYLTEAGKRKIVLEERIKDAVNTHNKQVNDFKEWAFGYFQKCYEKWQFDKSEAKELFYRAKNNYEKEQKNKKSSAETEKVIKELCEKFRIDAK